MTPNQAAEAIRQSGGRFFGATFIKRTTGERREMWCRFAEVGELKGGQRRSSDNLIVVWDDHKKAYRSIPVEGLVQLRIDGKCEEVEVQ